MNTTPKSEVAVLVQAVVAKIRSEVDYNIAAALFKYHQCLNNKHNELRMTIILPNVLPDDVVPLVEQAMINQVGWDDCKINTYFVPTYMPGHDKYDSQRNEVQTKLYILDVRLYTEYRIQGVNDN